MNLEKSIEFGMSIAIVGNAKSILNTQNGSEIDAADTVVRMNRGFPKKIRSQGAKTDVLALSCALEEKYYNKYFSQSSLMWMTPKMDNIPAWVHSSQPQYYPLPYWEKLYKSLNSSRPSTGAMTIDYICNYIQPQKLRIYGFDFKTTPTLYESKMKLGPHNWSIEEQFVSAIIQHAQSNGKNWTIV
ncbi:glycosyltransferase family 29 protein [Rubritalea spongiae]|uniref:Glycosyltransferase family 29 protein n=1 Tax=Rubritalea spongiae TaxID=430797 RepID=A0ABW5E7M8_9BACT